MSQCDWCVCDVCGLSIYNMFYSTYFVYIIVFLMCLRWFSFPRFWIVFQCSDINA